MAYGRKEVPKGQFNHRLGAGSGRIDDADATGASCHQVDVVKHGIAGSTDHLETVSGGVDDLGRKFGCTANDDGIKFSQCATEKFSRLLDVVHNDVVDRLFQDAERPFEVHITSVLAILAMERVLPEGVRTLG